MLHLHSLRRQPEAEGTFLRGGADLLRAARSGARHSAGGLRRRHRLPQVERSAPPASDCTPPPALRHKERKTTICPLILAPESVIDHETVQVLLFCTFF